MDDLPDLYACVACDVIRSCGRKDGLWVDLGCGSGSLALALAAISSARLLLVDPDPEALAAAMERAEELGLSDRTSAIVGAAERIPMKAGSADLVVSRGSIFFWDDRPAGLREVYRILRPGGKAMIGGGLGSGYPLWAREEFIRRRIESVRQQGPDAVRAFREVRSPETFRLWAREAGLQTLEIIREGGLDEHDPEIGLGIWLLFEKEAK